MPRIRLPEGCFGLDMPNGKKYTAKPGDYVNVSDAHARTILASSAARSGQVHGERFAMGTRTGRWCRSCTPARLWNAWNAVCPKCGTETIEESPE